MIIEVTDDFLSDLNAHKIYQNRSGMGEELPNYTFRWNLGDILETRHNCLIESYCTISAGNNLFSMGAFSSVASSLPPYSTVGRYSCIGENVRNPDFRHPIEAVSISSAFFNSNREFVHSYLSDFSKIHPDAKPRKDAVVNPQIQSGEIHIGHDVWIGDNVVIKGNIKIGNGAIVASNSYVTHDVEAYTIVGGWPAKVIRHRFDSGISNALEEIKWWNYELGDMLSLGLDFSKPDIFIDKFDFYKDKINFLNVERFSPFRSIFLGCQNDSLSCVFTYHNSILAVNSDNTHLRQITLSELSDFDKNRVIYYQNDFRCLMFDGNIIDSIDESGAISYVEKDQVNPSLDYSIIGDFESSYDINAIYLPKKNKYLTCMADGGFGISSKIEPWEYLYFIEEKNNTDFFSISNVNEVDQPLKEKNNNFRKILKKMFL